MLIEMIRPGMLSQSEVLRQRLRALAGQDLAAATSAADLWRAVLAVCDSAIDGLQRSEECMQLVVRASHDVVWDWDVARNEVQWNGNAAPVFGHRVDTIPHGIEWWHANLHPDERARVVQSLHAAMAAGEDLWLDEHRFRNIDGLYLNVENRVCLTYDRNGAPLRVVGAMLDVTNYRRAEARLRYDAFHDALTGLPNRPLFLDRLHHVFERARRLDTACFAVLLLDLDRFGTVNDSYGHLMGDELLQAVVQRLEPIMRSGDSLARLGADEFAILLEDLKTYEDVTGVGDRIQAALKLPFILRGHEVFVSGSIGIALYRPSYEQADDVLRDAAIAMNRARELGPGRQAIFDPAMYERAMERMQLEADLRQAIDRRELTLHYQPIVTVPDGKIIGVEALVRWQHPSRGMISPGDFIPLAEETGLIVPLGAWVLETACRQAREWHDSVAPDLQLAVNLSARQFKERALDRSVAQTLSETGFPPNCLHLELTESSITEDLEATISTLQRLKSIGVQVSIDDFGTGYSSLSYLKRFPISTVKIDRSFVRDISTDANDAAIVAAIIDLAHSLNLAVIAEGVETPEQLAFLGASGCEAFQGYLCSPAVSAATISALLHVAEAWKPPLT